MWIEDSAHEEKELDFGAWATQATKPSFEACARAALESLAISNDDLRSRLRGALFCLLYADRDRVPSVCRATFDEIANYVDERITGEKSHAALGQFTRRLKLKIARRLCRRIVKVYEESVARPAT
jgi:hypothetical protein